MSYRIVSLVKDASIKKALKKGLSDDGKLSFGEVKSILNFALDGEGVTFQDFKDLKAILKNSKTLDHRSKNLINKFLKLNYRAPAAKKSANQKLTKNFSLYEFACTDGTHVPVILIPNVKKLAKNLQVLRDLFNKPIKIKSAYRTKAKNDSLGSKENSQHRVAKAADIVIGGVTPKMIKSKIEDLIKNKKMTQGGIGLYSSFVHYDIRGYRARW